MKHFLHSLVMALALLCTGLAVADHDFRQPRWNAPRNELYERRQPNTIDMEDAIRRVQRQTGGRVLDARPVYQDGREAYRIKVLTRSGEVRVYYVDAQSGAAR